MKKEDSMDTAGPLILEFKLAIKWWSSDGIFPGGSIPMELQDALEESGKARAFAMMAEGYVQGELSDNINTDVPGVYTPEDGFSFRGWWSCGRMVE